MAEKLRSADEILRAKEPGDLFTGDPSTLKAEYHALVKLWHSDVNKHPKAEDVMRKITTLYETAEKMLASNEWKRSNMIRFVAKDGRTHEITFRACRDFELGKMYISDNVVTYVIGGEYKDLFDNALRTISGFKYANDNMKNEVSRYLPKVVATFDTMDNQLGMVVSKTPDLLLLSDVLSYFGGALCERHVAWITSSLLNILCYIDYSKLSHNGLTLDSYFISPSLHSGALLGGWWYAVSQGSTLKSVPASVYSLMPPVAKNTNTSNIMTDLESLRMVGRQLLGDPNGTKLKSMDVPQALINYFRGASPKTAVIDYERWRTVLTDAFGKRKFIPMTLTADMLYPK